MSTKNAKTNQQESIVTLVAKYIPPSDQAASAANLSALSKSYRLIRLKNERDEEVELVVDNLTLMDWQKLREYLINRGHPLELDIGYWKQLVVELAKPIATEFVLCTTLGYHDSYYLSSQGAVFGVADGLYRIHPDINLADIHEDQKGSLDEWKQNVAVYAEHSDLLMLLICASLSGALIKFAEMECGGFHIYGRSSTGKSTLFAVAASICGSPDFVKKWYATETGIEDAAAKHNDNVLLLDEIQLLQEAGKTAHGTAKLLQQLVFILSSGKGKIRVSNYQSSVKTWRSMYISNGEKSLEELAHEGGMSRMGGEEVRCISIPVKKDAKWGVFDSLPDGFEDSGALIKHLDRQAKLYYGTAKVAFVEGLLKNERKRRGKIRSEIDSYMADFIESCGLDDSEGFASRIAKRFALTYAAGVIATKLNILDFSESKIREALLRCYRDAIEANQESMPCGTSSPTTQKSLMEAHERVLSKVNYDAFLDLTDSKLPPSEEGAEAARGFVTTIKGHEVFAVKQLKFQKLVGSSNVAKKLIQKYLDEGVLLPGSKGESTRQLPVKIAGKRLPRCLCFIASKLK